MCFFTAYSYPHNLPFNRAYTYTLI